MNAYRIGFMSFFALMATSVVYAPMAQACANHDDGEFNFFLAYLDYRGLNEEQQNALRQKAIDDYHSDLMRKAQVQFASRFQVEEAPQEQPIVSTIASN